jgi:hypothetical protein
MKQNKPLRSILMIGLLVVLYGCFEIVNIVMPDEVPAGSSFVIEMDAKTTDSDSEAKYGIVAVYMPEDFQIDSMKYVGTNGEGYFYFLDNDSTSKYPGDGGIKSGWTDSLGNKFGVDDGFKWDVWEMEEPYSAEATENEYAITIYAKAGNTIGTYGMSFLITESSYELVPIEGEKTFDFRESQDQISVVEGTPILEDRPDLPTTMELEQNYPNPFNPATTITYSLPNDGPVRLTVTDINGRVVRNLVDTRQSAGTYRVTVDMLGLSSGVYLYRLDVAGQSITKSMTLIK